MNLFARARAQLNLSPGERAVLKLIEGFVLAGIVAALPVVAQLLAAQSVNWSDVARLAGGTFAVAALMAVAKFYKAQGDEPLSEVISLAAGHVANATGLNEPKQGVVYPVAPVAAPANTALPAAATPAATATADG